ncbi:MAG TPA: hypothetical protein VIW67_00755 [Terriglobales bacterium]|jgi:hypothetical protein
MRSSDKHIRPPLFRVLICALILAVGYYSYHLGLVTAHRENSLNELDGMVNAWSGIEAKTVKLAGRHAVTGSPSSESALQAMSRINQESTALRKRFTEFEARLRAKNNGVLPRWLKDDPNWQELDRIYHRNQTQ